MLLKYLIGEFEHEVNSTRKLLLAVPQKDLAYRPSPVSWTMGELAQHIATIYYWYVGTLTKDVNGRVITVLKGLTVNSPIQFGKGYHAGTYIAEVMQGQFRKQVKLIKL